jgi:hypothetical protein
MKSLLRRLLVIFPLLIPFVPIIGDTTEAERPTTPRDISQS